MVRVRDGVRIRLGLGIGLGLGLEIADLCDGGPLRWRTGTIHGEVRKPQIQIDKGGKCKYRKREYQIAWVEYASTENASTNLEIWRG